MFDDFEKEINALLKGGQQKPQKESSPQKKPTKAKETPVIPSQSTDVSVENLDLHGLQWGVAQQEKKQKQPSKTETEVEKKEYHPKDALKKADFDRLQAQANERLLRLQELQKELTELRSILRKHDTQSNTAQIQLEALQKVHQEQCAEHQQERDTLQAQLHSYQEQHRHYAEQLGVLEQVQREKHDLEQENRALRTVPVSNNYHTIAAIFEERGFVVEEFPRVLQWLIESKILPVSHVYIQNQELLRTILREQCHIQCAQIPLPQKQGHLYITVPKERCSFSAGFDILECARSIKDELLINGYTSVVIFGGQGDYENLFQVLFAHHALRITLAPPLCALSSAVREQFLHEHQIAVSFGATEIPEVFSVSATAVGDFLDQFATYLRHQL